MRPIDVSAEALEVIREAIDGLAEAAEEMGDPTHASHADLLARQIRVMLQSSFGLLPKLEIHIGEEPPR